MLTKSFTKCKRLLFYKPLVPLKNQRYTRSTKISILYVNRSSRYTKAASISTLSVYLTTSVMPYEWMCGLYGGVLLGAGSSFMLGLHGRIAGISGMLTKLFDSVLSKGNPNKMATCSQLGFVSGILASGIYWNYKNQQSNGIGIQLPCVKRRTQPFIAVPYSPYVLALGGLLVGIGTRLGSGCTTGHGICGLARRSPRSVAAVGAFFGTSVATTTVLNAYFPDLYKLEKQKVFKSMQLRKVSQYALPVVNGLMVCGAVYAGMRGIGNESVLSLIPSLMCGYLFGTGLVYSGMSKPDKVRAFLDVNKKDFAKHWDPTLGFVMGGAVLVTAVSFPMILRFIKRPILSQMYHLPTKSKLDQRLLIGSTLFGLGWGFGGICPGPGFIGLASVEHGAPMYIWFLTFFLGNRLVVLL